MDLVNSLLNADPFTKLDLRNAYGNLRVAEGDEDKLAFICHAGQFAPLTMPFGPTGAPGFFQYFIQDILLGRIGKDVAAYLDNIMIYTQKGSDHHAAVNSVLETLSKQQLWLKPEKCEFSRPEVEYLGLLISCNRLRMDLAKVKAVTNWPAPRNVTELQRFIGFANFYQRFIDHFSGTTRPLHDLTNNRTPFLWDNKCDAVFEALKTAFTTAPILKIADPCQPFVLECDCSDFALGAVLLQVCDKDCKLHPIAFLSRSLIQSEKNYKIFDKELLAIVASFKEWRHYLEGNPYCLKAIVYTDHRNLESFMTMKALTRRQARWAETMGCFDFEIVFRPGRQSSKPDALSRRPDLAPAKEDKLTFGQLLKPGNITEEKFAEIAEFEAWFRDEEIEMEDAKYWFQVDVMGVGTTIREVHKLDSDTAIIAEIQWLTPSDPQILRLLDSADKGLGESTQHDGVVYSGGRIKVPADNDIKYAIARSRHDSKLAGHPGRAKTLALVRRCFMWPLMKCFINRYVDGCGSCQRTKSSTLKPLGTLEPLPIPAGPCTDISYDMITDLPVSAGSHSILTVVNRLTKMAHFLPCRKTMAADQHHGKSGITG
jgi:hypothetical protein